MKIANTTIPKHSEEELISLLKNGLWSEDKGEVVVSFPNKKRTTLYLFMKNLEGKYIAVNISAIELRNLGTIGLKPQYKKLESKAIEWIEDTEELVMVKIETMIWSNAKCYRRSQPLLIKRNGEIMWR